MKYKKGDKVPLLAFQHNNNDSHFNSQIEYLSEVSSNQEMSSQEFRIITELFQNELGEDTDEYYFAFSNPPKKEGKASLYFKKFK